MQSHLKKSSWKVGLSAVAATVVLAPMLSTAGSRDTTAEVAASMTWNYGGQEFVFEKRRDASGNISEAILDERGRQVSARSLPRVTRNVLDAAVEDAVRDGSGARRLYKVNIALDLSDAGDVDLNRTDRRNARNGRLEAWAVDHSLQEQDGIRDGLESSGSFVTLELTAAEIEDLGSGRDPIVRGIELYEDLTDELDEAMVATSVVPWALESELTRGDGIAIYMTETGCPKEDANLEQYYRLDSWTGSATNHATTVGSIAKGVAPQSWLYCRTAGALPNNLDLDIGLTVTTWPADYPTVPIEMVTMSAGYNSSTDYRIMDREWDQFVYDNRIPAFSSAGNLGNTTGNVTTPGKAVNVITVGNYDDDTDTINSQSSFVDPVTRNDKPEIVAPGTNIFIDGVNKFSGTSWAAPHAAAFAADVMSQSKWFTRKPALMKALMLASATDPILGDCSPVPFPSTLDPCDGGGKDPNKSIGDTIAEKKGVGGINFHSANYSATKFYYEGSNDEFPALDQEDGVADGYITDEVFVYDSYDRVRVAMAWMNQGTWVYEHKNEFQPLSMDFDITVFDPTGAWVDNSMSYTNGFEVIDFEPTMSGNYTFKIERHSNNDEECDVRIGVVVSKIND